MDRAGPLLCSRHTSHKCTQPLRQYQKGYITQKLWSPGGSPGARSKRISHDFVFPVCQRSNKVPKRQLWFQVHQSDQEALSLTENTEISLVPKVSKLAMLLRTFKSAFIWHPCTLFLYWSQSLHNNKAEFLLLMQMSRAQCFILSWWERTGAEVDCGLPCAVNKSRYSSFLPTPFILLIENN